MQRIKERGEDDLAKRFINHVRTWNTDVVTEHEASRGGHNAWNDDDGRDLGLEFSASTRRTGEASRRHDCYIKSSLIFLTKVSSYCMQKEMKKKGLLLDDTCWLWGRGMFI